VLSINIRQALKAWPGLNTFTYLALSPVTKKKCFIKLTLGVDRIVEAVLWKKSSSSLNR
jgi:hypothetical protein